MSSQPPLRVWLLAAAAVTSVVLVVAYGFHTLTSRPPTPAAATASPLIEVGPGTAGTGTRSDGMSGMGTRPAFPGGRKTLPGASIQLLAGETFAAGLSRLDRAYGPLRMVRVFHSGLPPTWAGSPADVANRPVVVSFKAPPAEIIAGQHDVRLAAWFASVPRDRDVYWTYFHEPENDVEKGAYTAAQFRAAWRRVATLAVRVHNPRLKATLVLMCWTLNPKSNRQFTDFYPGGDVVDALGWDCYNSGARSNQYTEPAAVFAPLIEKSRTLGKPWGIAETGSPRTAGDTGAGRAAWLRAVSLYLNDRAPLWVAYFDNQVTGGDYRLTDQPSRDVWRVWCTAR